MTTILMAVVMAVGRRFVEAVVLVVVMTTSMTVVTMIRAMLMMTMMMMATKMMMMMIMLIRSDQIRHGPEAVRACTERTGEDKQDGRTTPIGEATTQPSKRPTKSKPIGERT